MIKFIPIDYSSLHSTLLVSCILKEFQILLRIKAETIGTYAIIKEQSHVVNKKPLITQSDVIQTYWFACDDNEKL